jgi:hypothetical protein
MSAIALHTPALLRTAQACPFTPADATQAQLYIMGRYTRTYLRSLLKVRRIIRANLAQAIAGGHLLQANEHATLMHSVGVQAVLLIRRNVRTHATKSFN